MLGDSHDLLGINPARGAIGEHDFVAPQILGAIESSVRAREDIGKTVAVPGSHRDTNANGTPTLCPFTNRAIVLEGA